MIFNKKTNVIKTPFGEGRYIGNDISVSWIRWNGILLDLHWSKDIEPDPNLVEKIEANLDSLITNAIDRIGIHEFPSELRTMVPDAVTLHEDAEEGNWSLNFRCCEWDDGIWGVIFQDCEIIKDYDGD